MGEFVCVGLNIIKYNLLWSGVNTMTKEEQKASLNPATTNGKELAIINSSSRWKNVEIFLTTQLDGTEILSGLFDNIATLYWLDLYKKMSLSKTHASEVIGRLIEGVHYIRLTREEIRELVNRSVHKSWTVDLRPAVFFFLTEEGWYRAVQEIGTGSMDNKEVAANIDRLKDEMAAIFAKYKRGEVIQLEPTDKPSLPPLSVTLKEELARADAMTIIGVDISNSSAVCIAKVEAMYNEDLQYLKKLVPRKSGYEQPTLTATAIGAILGMSAQSVNNLLERFGYSYHGERIKKTGRKVKTWNLTKKGMIYGEVHVELHGGSETSHILWRQSVVDALREDMFEEDRKTPTGKIEAAIEQLVQEKQGRLS